MQGKSLFDELIVVGRPLFPLDFNICTLNGFEFVLRDLITNLNAHLKPISFPVLHEIPRPLLD